MSALESARANVDRAARSKAQKHSHAVFMGSPVIAGDLRLRAKLPENAIITRSWVLQHEHLYSSREVTLQIRPLSIALSQLCNTKIVRYAPTPASTRARTRRPF